LKEPETEPGMEESDPREPEKLLSEFMVYQSIGRAEVSGGEQCLQKVDEDHHAHQYAKNIEGQRVRGSCQRLSQVRCHRLVRE